MDNPDKVLPAPDLFSGARLHFIVETPGRIESESSSGGPYVIPSKYTPYVAERSATAGFSLVENHDAQIAAGPTQVDAKEAATRRAWLVMTFYTGATDIVPEAMLESRWNRGRDDYGVETDMLDPRTLGRETLEQWNSIVAGAMVYDPRTHGIVRASSQADSLLRTAPDRLAPLAEVMEHRKEVYRASLPKWRRLAGLVMPSLVEPPLLG